LETSDSISPSRIHQSFVWRKKAAVPDTRTEASDYSREIGAARGWMVDDAVDSPAATPAAQVFALNPHANSSKLAIGMERDATNHPGAESLHGELAQVLIYERLLDDMELSNAINALKQTYFSGTAK
jgi:hypothetical protein